MSSPVEIHRGVRPLRRLLKSDTFDLRDLDVDSFLPWLEKHLVHWNRDPVFTQRIKIRELRRMHPRLRELEKEQQLALAADAKTPQHLRLAELEQKLIGTEKAIAGLTSALKKATGEKQNAMQQKLESFQIQQRELVQEQTASVQASPERQALLRINSQLQELRLSIGLDEEERRLEKLLKQKGRHSGHSGLSFETLAQNITRDYVSPDLGKSSKSRSAIQLLTGVTLGAARTEFDQLLIRPRGHGKSVEVLAVVEVKRNSNDLASGFRQRQENLAWVTGTKNRYDRKIYRNSNFPSGHFDRAVVHHQNGEPFLLDPDSFRRFQADAVCSFFLNHLYFITRPKTLWGISAADLGRISHRIATDERWNPDNPAYLSRLLNWCQSLTEPLETPDMLSLYSANPGLARKILFVKI